MSEVLRYEERFRRFRFLLTGGRVVDVDATRDDSALRGWLLEQVGGDVRIEGVTELPDQGELL